MIYKIKKRLLQPSVLLVFCIDLCLANSPKLLSLLPTVIKTSPSGYWIKRLQNTEIATSNVAVKLTPMRDAH